MRQRHLWEPKPADKALLKAVIDLIDGPDYRDFWPLTLRQIYYGLVSDLVIENTKGSYKRLGSLLTKARLSEKVSWDAVEDRNRDNLGGTGFKDAADFIRYSQQDFLTGYSRDLSQSQTTALEIWVEKDALARVVHDVSSEYCLPTIVAKGYSSVSYVNELRDRINRNRRADDVHPEGRPTKVLYFGDLDPSGWNMLPAMFLTLHEEMEVSEYDVEYERCALNKAQVQRFRLPQSPDALKDDEWQRTHGDPNKTKGDPRAEAYKKMFGNMAVELDAFKPTALQDVVRAAIERNMDMPAYRREQEQQSKDEIRIDKMKKKVARLLKE